jgi:uncharacterized protein
VPQEFDELFAKVRRYGYDPNKRDWTLRERGIDFDEVRFVFDGPTLVYRSDRGGEERYVVLGLLDDVEIVLVCTFRSDLCWVISARRASRHERKKYHDHFPRCTPAQRQD